MTLAPFELHRPRSVPEAEELPRDPLRLPGGSGNTTRGEGVRRGVGFAVGFKNIGYSEGYDDYTAARVRLLADGSAEVHCAAAEVGQGVAGVILQVARTELETNDVTLAPHTTATVGSAGSASASRMTWMASGAVREVRIIKSPHQALSDEVVAKLKNWKYKPYPKGFIAEYEFNFEG